MPNFCIQAVGGADTERYWVNAESEREARRLVALNAVGLAAAEDVSLFGGIRLSVCGPLAALVINERRQAVDQGT